MINIYDDKIKIPNDDDDDNDNVITNTSVNTNDNDVYHLKNDKMPDNGEETNEDYEDYNNNQNIYDADVI